MNFYIGLERFTNNSNVNICGEEKIIITYRLGEWHTVDVEILSCKFVKFCLDGIMNLLACNSSLVEY